MFLPGVIACAVQRHGLPVGANPTRRLSLQPEAIGAAVEVTNRLKPSVLLYAAELVSRLNPALGGWANYFYLGSVTETYRFVDAYTN